MTGAVQRARMGGAVISSNHRFPEMDGGAAVAPDEPVDLHVTVDGAADPAWLDDGAVISTTDDVELRRTEDGFVLDLDDSVMEFSADGRRLRAWRSADTDAEAFRHTVLDVAIPYALALQGRTVLHATAVSVNGHAVAFAGHSGHGKSTMAAALAVRFGAAILADDCLCVTDELGRLTVQPSYPGLRLRPDSHSAVFGPPGSDPPAGPPDPGAAQDRPEEPPEAKVRVGHSPDTFVAGTVPVPLGAIVVLDRRPDQPAPTMRRLGSAEAFVAVVQHRLQLDVDTDLHADLLKRFSVIAERVPVYRLSFTGTLGLTGPLTEVLTEVLAPVLG